MPDDTPTNLRARDRDEQKLRRRVNEAFYRYREYGGHGYKASLDAARRTLTTYLRQRERTA
ncbi:MAG: hypothetical protein GWN53_17425 [Gammaproteobacteria bacterium]|uniref:Uncharacterized protein n=1 Tax=Candidatus Kutchimonas denitrificans TaxID=3056748 RepID=A0AAE4ZDQ0_9BACT|nr:hypothetical protein [Candidatus Kutchimonas denitrificans]NIV53623.1 hypothetical protein [Gammaproteobacteria bacterium]